MSKTRLPELKSLCVFCGSSIGDDPAFAKAATALGAEMAAQNIRLVFGGGHLGMMGAVAEAVLNGGGTVLGIIPEHLTRIEVAFLDITELVVVDSMHTRKRAMFDASDAFCILPGGMGTMDETFEILTWKQLRLHNKPIIMANLNGYWDPWIALSDHIMKRGFARPETRALYSVVTSIDDVLPKAREELAGMVEGAPELF